MKTVSVDERSYCVVAKKKMYYNDALKKCESLNARLPLPRNKNESDAFMKILGYGWGFAHADARNPMKTGNKKFWIDAEDKQIGNRDVYL